MEPLTKEQLDAVRGAVASLDQLYADHPQLRSSRSEENQILFESLTSNGVTIRALLAHIDTQERRIERMRNALDDAHEELKARRDVIQSLQGALKRR